MILNRESGGYLQGEVMRLCGSFRINGTSTPDGIRDGKSNYISSVARVSAGLFTVTLSSNIPLLPQSIVAAFVGIAQVAAPTQACRAAYVLDSYSAITRTFQVKCLDFDTPSAVDPDDNDQISFELVGSANSAGVDTRA